MRGFLPAKGRRPFAHVKAGFIDTNLVRKRRLERLLPVVLKFAQALFRAATGVAHPRECLRKELPNISDPVVVQAIDHTFDDRTSGLGFGHICIAAKNRLFWA